MVRTYSNCLRPVSGRSKRTCLTIMCLLEGREAKLVVQQTSNDMDKVKRL